MTREQMISDMGVQSVADPGYRVDSGSVQFGDDWPGLFIRGDHAMHFAAALDSMLDLDSYAFDGSLTPLARLVDLLKATEVGPDNG